MHKLKNKKYSCKVANDLTQDLLAQWLQHERRDLGYLVTSFASEAEESKDDSFVVLQDDLWSEYFRLFAFLKSAVSESEEDGAEEELPSASISLQETSDLLIISLFLPPPPPPL